MRYTRGQWKELLQSRGQWDAFQARRDELKASMTPAKAYKQAQTEFTQSLNLDRSPRVQSSSPDEATPVSPEIAPEGELSAMAEEWSPPNRLLPAMARRNEFRKDEILDPLENIRWVASNIYTYGVQMADAPSRIAWNMMWKARTDPAFETEFWRTIFPRTITKGEDRGDEYRDENIPLTRLVEVVATTVDHVQRAAEEAHAGTPGDAVDGLGDAAFKADEPETADEYPAEAADT